MRIEKNNERGFAIIIALLLISLMLAFALFNTNTLFQLKREVKLLDSQHQKRWAELNARATNRVEVPK